MKFALTPCLMALLASAQIAMAQATAELLTNASDILSLPTERALSGIPVSIEGVVTAAQTDWQGRFFVQDPSAGIFVENIGETQPAPGDVVRVTGVTHPGGFAPIITQPRWEKLGTAPLPAATSVSVEELVLGIADSQRIEISGIVRAVDIDGVSIVYDIVSGGYRFRAFTPASAAGDPQLLVGTRVRVRGTAATSFHPELRHLVSVTVYVPLASDLIIIKTYPGDPFDEPVIPLNEVAQYHRDYTPGERIHVRGKVTYQRPGQDLFLRDATAGLRVKTRQLDTVVAGDVVEVIGFPGYEQFLPVLEDAVFRKVEAASTPPRPQRVPLEALQAGLHHAELITIQGKLLDRTVRHEDPDARPSAPAQVTLTLQTSNFLCTAEGPMTNANAGLAAIPLGSIVELDGIGMLHIRMGGTMESGDVGTMESLQLLLPGDDTVRVLQKPSWLTARRLLIGLAVISAILLLAITWSITVSRKNAALRVLVREKMKAQDELQKAHDELDERVKERTAQLKFEMDARKESEVRFKATLAERTRLAQELHDTTEQSLTGISLQLDTAAKLFEKGSDGATRHLEVARVLMSRSQMELRRSIWDLRSRELEQFDLPNALRMSAREILADANVEADLTLTGQAHPLSEVAEQNLLRIGREALTNVVKHARATRVELRLSYGPETVTLRVQDDGRGFRPAEVPGSREGHFGLLGMSERAKRFHGELRVTSTPGSGTCLEVEIPLRNADQPDPTATTAESHVEI